jgi:hypothetical protein
MIWVDLGGKIVSRQDGYFAFDDGSQGPEAVRSTTPVRRIMEFDGVGADSLSVAMSVGPERIQSVPPYGRAKRDCRYRTPASRKNNP